MSQILASNSYVYVTKNCTQGTNKKRSVSRTKQYKFQNAFLNLSKTFHLGFMEGCKATVKNIFNRVRDNSSKFYYFKPLTYKVLLLSLSIFKIISGVNDFCTMHTGWNFCVIFYIQLSNQFIFRKSQDASVLLSSLNPMKQESKKQKRSLISLKCSQISEPFYEEGLHNAINIGCGIAKLRGGCID